jgi:hypothetical protein
MYRPLSYILYFEALVASVHVDVQYSAVTWSFLAIYGITTLMCPYMSMHRSVYVQTSLIHPVFRGISASVHVDVQYSAVTWSFLAIHGITTLMCPYMSMHRSVNV